MDVAVFLSGVVAVAAATTSSLYTCRPRPRTAFLVPRVPSPRCRFPFGRVWVAAPPSEDAAPSNGAALVNEDDEELLQTVSESLLVDLCDKCDLPSEGTKKELLHRLRLHAAQQTAAEEEIRKSRQRRVKAGSDALSEDALEGSRAKHRIVNDEGGLRPGDDQAEEPEEQVFFIPLPNATLPQDAPNSTTASSAPPEGSGERVTTIYSTKDRNDLTGLTAQADRLYGGFSTTDASPVGGSPIDGSPLAATLGSMGEASASSAEGEEPTKPQSKTDQQLEESRKELRDLFSELLESTGAPGFRDEYTTTPQRQGSSKTAVAQNPDKFTGFRPQLVPPDRLTEASPHLRAAGGDVLKEITSEWEIQAIGLDGLAADDVQRGGGHYREVSKVAAFLEGFRRAEVRRVCRETASMLLDVLVSRGVEGLDTTLATMKRSSSSGDGEGGELLDDALLQFLDDTILEQQDKVDRSVGGQAMTDRRMGVASANATTFFTDRDVAWNATNDSQGDPAEETIHLNQTILEQELQEQEEMAAQPPLQQNSPIEQSLLLLTLLRDRLKTEAMFAQDERTKGLRVLAYCLRATTDSDRERLVMDNLGSSLERLEAFADLVESAMEYGESTSYQLQPQKTNTLNMAQLKKISRLIADIRQRQLQKASELAP